MHVTEENWPGKIAAERQMKPVPHAVKYTFLALWLRL